MTGKTCTRAGQVRSNLPGSHLSSQPGERRTEQEVAQALQPPGAPRRGCAAGQSVPLADPQLDVAGNAVAPQNSLGSPRSWSAPKPQPGWQHREAST